jgi:hypothetical protein
MSERFERREGDARDPDLAAPELTSLYREASREEPPAAIDAAILAAARASTKTPAGTSGGGGEPRSPRWRTPFAIAAVLVLSATLVIQMRDEPQSPLDPAVLADSARRGALPDPGANMRAQSPVARDQSGEAMSGREPERMRAEPRDRPPPAAPAPATDRIDGPPHAAAGVASGRAAEAVAESASKAIALDERRRIAANRVPEAERPATARTLPSSGPTAPAPAPEPPFQSPVHPPLSAAPPPGVPSLEAKRSASPAAMTQSGAPSDSAQDRDRLAREASPPLAPRPDAAAPFPASPSAPVAAPAPAPSPARGAGGVSGQAGERSRAATSADVSRMEQGASGIAAPAGRAAAPATAPDPASSAAREPLRKTHVEETPEQWLARIEQLFREGRDREAKEALDAFRKRHPTHELPAALRGR